jgi:hypothetical protein
MVSMRPWKELWRFQLDCGILIKTSATLFFLEKVVFSIKLCLKQFGCGETAEADSAVSMRPLKQLLLSQ